MIWGKEKERESMCGEGDLECDLKVKSRESAKADGCLVRGVFAVCVLLLRRAYPSGQAFFPLSFFFFLSGVIPSPRPPRVFPYVKKYGRR